MDIKKSYMFLPVILLILVQVFRPKHPPAWKTEDGVFGYRDLIYIPDDKPSSTFHQPSTTITKFIHYWSVQFIAAVLLKHYPVTIHNARVHDIDYNVTGFTLVDSPLKEDLDWKVTENREYLYSQLEPVIRELHPDADIVAIWDRSFISRDVEGDNPPGTNVPHLDWYWNQTYLDGFVSTKTVDQWDFILGIWKPTHMNNQPVTDLPLTIIDASSLTEDKIMPVATYVNQKEPGQEALGYQRQESLITGALKYHPDQRWFYYQNQLESEVLIFRHWTRDRTFANPHVAFTEPDFVEGSQTRRSIELRVGITLKKE